jgi:hypothetical protein
VADIIRRAGNRFLDRCGKFLSWPQLKVLRAIERCRTTVKPMFDLLGTPPDQKKLNVYESDHFIPSNELIKETLAWLDHYLGPVK